MGIYQTQARTSGFTFVELLITAAMLVIVFGGLIGAFVSAMKLIGNSKVTTSALALVTERIEYLKSLPYDSVGTVSGIPNGSIPQYATTTMNDLLFHERVLIQYVDSPDDGLGAADDNGILADYKQARVEYSWFDGTATQTVFLLTNIVPPSIESTAGGGTLAVNVFDAEVAPVSGAEVHVVNRTTTSTIDVTTYTNAAGIAYFAGAPEAANYEITVTNTGYSTDQTYSATTSNPNPTTPHVAVVESTISTMNFQIDELSDLTVRTIGEPTTDQFLDSFADLSTVGSSTDVTLGTDDIILSGGAGAYVPVGTLFATTTDPFVMSAWGWVDFTPVTPGGTTLLVRVYTPTSTGAYVLIPDAALPGNSAGFTTGPIDISSLDTTLYGALVLGATLTTSDVNVTPELDAWEINYTIDEPQIASVPFTLTGAKTIGTTLASAPIYKYEASHTTDGTGDVTVSDLEWDVYSLDLDTGAYTIKEACATIPYTLSPGVDDTLTLTLVGALARSLRVVVVDEDSDPVIGATVDLSRSGFSDSGTTGGCGQYFFDSGLADVSDYQLDVSAAGYDTANLTGVIVSGNSTVLVTLIAP